MNPFFEKKKINWGRFYVSANEKIMNVRGEMHLQKYEIILSLKGNVLPFLARLELEAIPILPKQENHISKNT